MITSPTCHLIAVLGGKGGVGKSVFAANFAMALMLEQRSQVLLIDADGKSAGDQNVILGIRPQKTIGEIASFQGSLTPQNLPQIVTTHSSGLAYIGAVRGPEESFKVAPDAFLKPLEFLSRHYKYIVVDLGNDLQAFQLMMLQEATVAMMITAPEVLVINQTQRLVQDLLTQTFPLEMFQLVINKSGPGALSPQAIAQSLRLNPLGLIPQDDVTTAQSLSKSTPFVIGANKTPVAIAYHDLVRKLTGGPLQKLKALQKPQAAAIAAKGDTAQKAPTTAAQAAANLVSGGDEEIDPRDLLKMRIHHELIKVMDLKKGVADTNGDRAKEEALRQKTVATITTIIDRQASGTQRDERSRLIKEVLEEALGLGPLEDLLADPAVTEIMVNGYKKIFIERAGKITLSTTTFTSNMHLRNVIERIVTPLGRRIDEKTPYVDARLKDGSRVNAIIEPLSIDGPAVTIRKFKKGGITAERYIEYGSVTKPMVDFLKLCVENSLNIVISGGTGSGKTSLLNMMSGFIPSNVRVVTVEDAAELQMQQPHVVRLETRPANMEGTGAVTIRDLIKNALRMRPDRIVVGETRDGAALDMLQAMNTGHDGSMTTTHANSPRECIARLETLCLMSGMDLPLRAIREQIASAVNLIIQISRLSDGSRKIISVTEVCGMQGDTVTLQEIFRFKETGFDKNRKIIGQFQAMGLIPTFIEKLEQKGVIIPREIFSNEPPKIAPKAAPNMKSPTMPQAMPQMKKTGTGGST
ncbi:MAG: ATPase, T2SS/T4P/T4SS family [Bdellovibrio sp.]|jgi:pilus assembly protein CpaF